MGFGSPTCAPKTALAVSSSPRTTSLPKPCAGSWRSSSPATADYGAVERGVEEKIAQVLAQLRSGEARLVFDPETETANIAPARDLPQR